MHDDAATAGDEADELVVGHRPAAGGHLGHQVADALDDDLGAPAL
jgi:hypothetical protein